MRYGCPSRRTVAPSAAIFAAEAPLPKAVADDRAIIALGSRLIGEPHRGGERVDPHHVEKRRRYARDLHLLGLTLSGQIHLTLGEAAMDSRRSLCARPVPIVRGRRVRLVRVVAVPDGHEPIGLAEREASAGAPCRRR